MLGSCGDARTEGRGCRFNWHSPGVSGMLQKKTVDGGIMRAVGRPLEPQHWPGMEQLSTASSLGRHLPGMRLLCSSCGERTLCPPARLQKKRTYSFRCRPHRLSESSLAWVATPDTRIHRRRLNPPSKTNRLTVRANVSNSTDSPGFTNASLTRRKIRGLSSKI